MAYFTLISTERNEDSDELAHRIQFEFQVEDLDTAVMYLDMFLKGSGYVYKGELGIIENE